MKIEIKLGDLQTTITLTVEPSERVEEVIRRALSEMGIEEEPSQWRLVFQGRPLSGNQLMEEVLQGVWDTSEIPTLRLVRLEVDDALELMDSDIRLDASDGAGISLSDDEFLLTPDEDHDFDEESDSGSHVLAMEDSEAGVDQAATMLQSSTEQPALLVDDSAMSELDAIRAQQAPAAGAALPDARPRQQERRATVRYYNRMNPQRVYPLLVMITQQLVQRVAKKHTSQETTGPFKVDLDAPVEIEPIIPGCDCFPSKMTTRLGSGDFTATFHIVPHVVGKVSGAIIRVQQDHALLAEIELDIKVRQRILVLAAGLAAFALPFLSAFAQHFGLDFASQKETGYSIYITVAQFLLTNTSPYAVAAVLAVITGGLYWRTRPKMKDAFWTIKTISPAQQLQSIADRMSADPDMASRELMELLKVYPTYQPARLFFADWHYRLGNYKEALEGFEQAFQLGAAPAKYYVQAALAASHLKLDQKALDILLNGEALLPKDSINGVMLYNIGCYYARLNKLDDAMRYLRRAAAAGYRKRSSYLKDSDLKPLSQRLDFQALMADLADD